MPSQAVINEFLQQKRLAVVGVSRNRQAFPNTVYRQLLERGYQVLPVNQNASEVEGVPCYPSVRELPEPVDGVIVMVPAARSAAVVADCQAAGIRRVWLHKGAGAGAVSPEAVAAARQAGMALVDGACPHMFLGGSWIHGLHRHFTRLDP